MAAKAMSQEEINNALKLTLGKLVQETEVTQEDTKVKEVKIEEAIDIADATLASSGVESEDVETPETVETDAEAAEEAEPKGVEASKIEDVVDEEIPASSEEKTKSEKEDREAVKARILAEMKIEKRDRWTAKVAEGDDEIQIIVTAIMSKAKGQRYYIINAEDKDGNKFGALNFENKFVATKFEKKSNDVSDFIKNMPGIYSGQMGDIMLKLMAIEKYRLLDHSPVLDVDNSASIEELIDKLKTWIISNIYDNRIAIFSMKNITHIAFVRRNEKSLLQVFKDVIREVDERVDVNVVKGKLYTEDLLYHDYNPKCRDTQLTISSSVREQIGSRGDKVISIKFEEEFIERVLAKRLNDQFDFIANFDDELEDYFGEED